ncbi:MAG: hypothetical protein PHS84_08655 [Paludibacter sp.]|jgi:hypothetical protein|nr:hypothetical protein [Paludibacter sp.]
MKTSNKLLLGLFILVVLGMIFANFRLKSVIGTSPQLNGRVSGNNSVISIKVNTGSDSTTIQTNSSEGDLNYGLFADKTKVLLSMDKNTTYEQLNQYKNDLKKLNIDLNIRRVEFSSDNKINLLKITVDCNDGFKGTVTQSLKGNEKIGFYRVYDNSASSPFGMYAIPLE